MNTEKVLTYLRTHRLPEIGYYCFPDYASDRSIYDFLRKNPELPGYEVKFYNGDMESCYCVSPIIKAQL